MILVLYVVGGLLYYINDNHKQLLHRSLTLFPAYMYPPAPKHARFG